MARVAGPAAQTAATAATAAQTAGGAASRCSRGLRRMAEGVRGEGTGGRCGDGARSEQYSSADRSLSIARQVQALSQAKSSHVKPRQATPSHVKPSPATPSQVQPPRQAMSSHVKPRQATSSHVKPCQAEQSIPGRSEGSEPESTRLPLRSHSESEKGNMPAQLGGRRPEIRLWPTANLEREVCSEE